MVQFENLKSTTFRSRPTSGANALPFILRDDIIPLDASRGSTPFTCPHAYLVHLERSLTHKSLGHSPHQRVICPLDVEVKAPFLCASEFDVSRQVTSHDLRLVAVFTDQATYQFDSTHATSNGVMAGILSRSTRRSRRSS